jgi:hypothetical protein
VTDPGRRLLGLLLLHSAIAQVVTFVLRPTSAYRALELDVPAAWLGALTASFAVVPLVPPSRRARPPTASASDG